MNREAQIAERLRHMAPKYRPMYHRAVRGKSLRACVNSQCLECMGWQSREVAGCTDLSCPLYAVRPYQDGAGTGQDGQFPAIEDSNDAGDAE